jgi:hypothetical protein
MSFGDSASFASVPDPGGTSTAGEQLKNPWGWKKKGFSHPR